VFFTRPISLAFMVATLLIFAIVLKGFIRPAARAAP